MMGQKKNQVKAGLGPLLIRLYDVILLYQDSEHTIYVNKNPIYGLAAMLKVILKQL